MKIAVNKQSMIAKPRFSPGLDLILVAFVAAKLAKFATFTFNLVPDAALIAMKAMIIIDENSGKRKPLYPRRRISPICLIPQSKFTSTCSHWFLMQC